MLQVGKKVVRLIPDENIGFFKTDPTFLFPKLKIKLKGHHFDTFEVIKAESQVVLNTLGEHDFQDAFK
jgi:hypothetical protein